MASADLTAARLREILDYSIVSGRFYWRESRGRVHAGQRAGSPNKDGYMQIGIDGCSHYAHRLAFLWLHGTWPPEEIDHADGIKANCQWINLRCASRLLNSENMRPGRRRKHSLPMGVRKNGNLFRATLVKNGKQIHLGNFAEPEAAHAVYVAEKRRLHAGCMI